jgi:hypothetical protein
MGLWMMRLIFYLNIEKLKKKQLTKVEKNESDLWDLFLENIDEGYKHTFDSRILEYDCEEKWNDILRK